MALLTRIPKDREYWRVQWWTAPMAASAFYYFDGEDEALAYAESIAAGDSVARVYRIDPQAVKTVLVAAFTPSPNGGPPLPPPAPAAP